MDALAQFIQQTSHPQGLKRALAAQMIQRQYPYREIKTILQVSLGFISQWVEVYEQQGVDAVITDVLDRVSQVHQRIADRTAKQILAVVKFRESHASSLRAVAESRFMSLRKS